MSLQRMRLRSAFVRALSNGGVAPYPTIAEDRVYDSRIGRIQEAESDQMMPLVAVYTDTDKRRSIESGQPANKFRRDIDVVLEVAIGTWTAAPDGDRVFVAPQTDAELEAMLDMLEFQIWRAIYDELSSNAVALWRLVKEVVDWDSTPGRSAEGNNKISARQITITCRVSDDCRDFYGGAAFDLDALWPSYLSSLRTVVNTHPQFRVLRDQLNLAAGVKAPPAGDKLESIGVDVDYIDPVVDRSLLPDGQTLGPDGRIEIRGDWDLKGD